MYNYIDYPNSFDLDSDGVNDTRGEGSFVVIGSIPEPVAKRIDKKLEKTSQNQTWREQGKVKYAAKSETLSIYLAGGD